jgi:hypothetical protein
MTDERFVRQKIKVCVGLGRATARHDHDWQKRRAVGPPPNIRSALEALHETSNSSSVAAALNFNDCYQSPGPGWKHIYVFATPAYRKETEDY